jgi:hypothetical protein
MCWPPEKGDPYHGSRTVASVISKAWLQTINQAIPCSTDGLTVTAVRRYVYFLSNESIYSFLSPVNCVYVHGRNCEITLSETSGSMLTTSSLTLASDSVKVSVLYATWFLSGGLVYILAYGNVAYNV